MYPWNLRVYHKNGIRVMYGKYLPIWDIPEISVSNGIGVMYGNTYLFELSQKYLSPLVSASRSVIEDTSVQSLVFGRQSGDQE